MLKLEKLFVVCFLSAFFLMSDATFGQKINQFNDKNQRIGEWRKYYPNNRIRYEGQFKNGKEAGIFKFYDQSSSQHPTIIKKFKPDTDSVFTQFYTVRGQLQSEGVFVGKKREGKWVYYFPSKKKMSIENYKSGLLEGELINYYPNGKITEKTQYKNGKKEGISLKFSSDGDILEEVNYQNDRLHGEAKYYDTKGQLKEQGIYQFGKRFGKWEYYLDGEVVNKQKKKKFKKQKRKK